MGRVHSWLQVWLQCNSGGRQELWLKSSSSGKKQEAPSEMSQWSRSSFWPSSQVFIRPWATSYTPWREESRYCPPLDFKGFSYSSVLDTSLFPTAQDLKKDVFPSGNPALKHLSCLTTAVSLNLNWTALCISQAPSWLINSLIPTLQQIPEGSSQFKTRDELPLNSYPNPHLISQDSADTPPQNSILEGNNFYYLPPKLVDKGGAALQSQMFTELHICPEHSSHPSCQGWGGPEGNS